MRLGSCVLFINNYCYLSYKWNFWRPLGTLTNVLKSLDEYEVDEIFLLRPIKGEDKNDSWNRDLREIKQIKLSTPLSFGGGIRSLSRLNSLKNLPVERLVFSNSMINPSKKDSILINRAISEFGRQAIVSLLPYKILKDEFFFYSSQKRDFIKLSKENFEIIDRMSNEIILYDALHEGLKDKINLGVLSSLEFEESKIILSGGIGPSSIKSLNKNSSIAAIYLDNSTLFKEQTIKKLKRHAGLS